jgi:hypothetical protein
MSDNNLTSIDIRGKNISDEDGIFDQLQVYSDTLLEVIAIPNL